MVSQFVQGWRESREIKGARTFGVLGPDRRADYSTNVEGDE